MLDGKKTYLGLAVVAIPTVAKLFGFDTLPAFSEQFVDVAEAVIVLAGAAVALYGRLVATVPGWFARK